MDKRKQVIELFNSIFHMLKLTIRAEVSRSKRSQHNTKLLLLWAALVSSWLFTCVLRSIWGHLISCRQGTPTVLAIVSSSSFFWQHVFFTYFSTSDFDQTWSKWPVPWSLRNKRWWGQGSLSGHWGQKGHFHKKSITSFRLHSYQWRIIMYGSYGHTTVYNMEAL